MYGTLIFDPDLAWQRHARRPEALEPRDPRRSTCPYCLEILTDLLEDSIGVCPLCRHRSAPSLCRTPVHLFKRPQTWDLLANEMAYIWDWEFQLLESYQTSMSGYDSPSFEEARADFIHLGEAKDSVLRLREEFLEHPGDLEVLIAHYLENYPQGGGDLAKDLLKGKVWRDQARELSARGAGRSEILEFQIGFVAATSWGAFGMNPLPKILLLQKLEAKKLAA